MATKKASNGARGRILLISCCLVSADIVNVSAEDQPHEHSPSQAQAQSTAEESDKHGEHHGMVHSGMYGSYPGSREASGTSWQPEATPMGGLHFMPGDWMFMLHGSAAAVIKNK